MPITIIFTEKKTESIDQFEQIILLEMAIIALIFTGNTIVQLNKFYFFVGNFQFALTFNCTNNCKEKHFSFKQGRNNGETKLGLIGEKWRRQNWGGLVRNIYKGES